MIMCVLEIIAYILLVRVECSLTRYNHCYVSSVNVVRTWLDMVPNYDFDPCDVELRLTNRSWLILNVASYFMLIGRYDTIMKVFIRCAILSEFFRNLLRWHISFLDLIKVCALGLINPAQVAGPRAHSFNSIFFQPQNFTRLSFA